MKFEGGFGLPYIGLRIILLFILLPGYTGFVTNYERRCRQSAEMEDTYGSKEMERLIKIFTGFIEQHKSFELLYSKELDCYLLLDLNFYRKDVEDTGCYYEPKEFCRKMFEIIAQDAFALSEYEHDEPEPVEMKQLLGVYTEQPSEYKGVSDEELRGYGVVD